MEGERIEGYRELATRIRAHCLRMTHRGQSGHLGSMVSMADLLAVLYTSILRVSGEPRVARAGPVRSQQGTWGDRRLRGAGRAGLFPQGMV